MCACVRACVRVCVYACMRVCVRACVCMCSNVLVVLIYVQFIQNWLNFLSPTFMINSRIIICMISSLK